MLHPNNKQNKNTNPIISRYDYHLTQSCSSDEKKKNKKKQKKKKKQARKPQHKSLSCCTKLTPTTGPTLGGRKPKKNKEFNLEAWEKETSNTIRLKNNNNEKAEKYCTNEGKQQQQ